MAQTVIEKHPIKIQVATVAVAIMFIIGMTRVITQDRDVAYAQIAEIKKQNERVESDLAKYVKSACDTHDKTAKEIDELQKKSHATDIAYTEIKTKLAGVEVMLIKIDQKLK